MPRSTRPLAKRLTLPLLCACTRSHRTRGLIPSNARSDGELSGYFLMVRSGMSSSDDGKINLALGSAADKSMSILLGRPICLRDEDCTVHFPKELDDE
jgi:hypothetical protein